MWKILKSLALSSLSSEIDPTSKFVACHKSLNVTRRSGTMRLSSLPSHSAKPTAPSKFVARRKDPNATRMSGTLRSVEVLVSLIFV